MVAAGLAIRLLAGSPVLLDSARLSVLTDRLEEALRQELAHFIFIS
jgi:hypothetical protein